MDRDPSSVFQFSLGGHVAQRGRRGRYGFEFRRAHQTRIYLTLFQQKLQCRSLDELDLFQVDSFEMRLYC